MIDSIGDQKEPLCVTFNLWRYRHIIGTKLLGSASIRLVDFTDNMPHEFNMCLKKGYRLHVVVHFEFDAMDIPSEDSIDKIYTDFIVFELV